MWWAICKPLLLMRTIIGYFPAQRSKGICFALAKVRSLCCENTAFVPAEYEMLVIAVAEYVPPAG